jgi:hypothetical protein
MEINDNIKSHLLRLYQIALVDDEFLKEEWDLLVFFAKSRGVSRKQLEETLLNPVGEIIYPEQEKEKLDYLLDLSRMMWVDGKVTDEERTLFFKFYDNFGLPHEHRDLIVDTILDKKNLECSNDKLIDIILF